MEKNKGSNQVNSLKLAELDQIYSVCLDLLQKSQNPDELLDKVLDEYIRRFSEMPAVDIQENLDSYADEEQREKVRALIMFAQQASLLKENADYQAKLKARNQELNRLTQKLKQANHELRRLNSHYLNMLGFVSHELRSPLISILGFAELLEEGFLGELNLEQQNSVQIIIRVARNLIEMIRNYLDLAKIENGDLVIQWQDVEILSQILLPVCTELDGHLLARGMKIVPEENARHVQQVHVQGDPLLFKVVFTNVISNAIKYGRPNTPILYNILDLEDQYYFTVTNQGDGVPRDKLEKIFEKFSQTVNYNQDLPRGTGLGLFNTRCILEAHGGKIWAESEPGKWFKICMTLPKQPSRKPKFVRLGGKNAESGCAAQKPEKPARMNLSPGN
ncbi:MAG: sensor histidine kinase [Calditrichaeota bacterium]|nr:MAG: sensor histidine kinase [Calditrichota bacterium]